MELPFQTRASFILESGQTMFMVGEKLVWQGPAVFAKDLKGNIVALGQAAVELLDLPSEQIQVIWPFKGSLVSKESDLADFIGSIINQNKGGLPWWGWQAQIALPAAMPSLHQDVVKRVFKAMGALKISLLPRSLLYARSVYGEKDVFHPTGLLYLGRDESEISLVLGNEVRAVEKIDFCWNQLVKEIQRLVRHENQVAISKTQAVALLSGGGSGELWVRGKSLVTQNPATVKLAVNQLNQKINSLTSFLLIDINRFSAKLSPEIHAQLIEKGWLVAGAGFPIALIKQQIIKNLGCPANIAPGENLIKKVAAAKWA